MIHHAIRLNLGIAASVVFGLSPLATAAQSFAALVSPPRFELSAKPGEKLRDVLELSNADARAAKWRIRTADWTFEKNGNVAFHDELQAGSCRPWVAIEKREVMLPAGGKYRYRFEVTPPPNTPDSECRFALLIEGDEMNVQTPGGPPVPIAGRIAVIVYVAVGKAAPALEVTGSEITTVSGETLPTLRIRNSGNAHGRLSGFLAGTDASGRKLEFMPTTLPILPGETRAVPLHVQRDKDEPIKIAYPITIRGTLEWADKSVAFEQRFAP